MALADVARKGVATALKITKSFQPAVTITPWIGQDGGGNDSYGTPVPYVAGTGVLVDREMKQVPTTGGRIMVVQATIYFLVPIANTSANTGQVRSNPVDPRDIVKLDDGFTAPILSGGGFEDAGTQKPFVTTIRLGSLR